MRGPAFLIALLALFVVAMSTAAQTPTPPPIRYTIGGHQNGVNNVALSSDGQTFASAGVDGTVKLWRMSDSALIHTFFDQSAPVSAMLSVALSPDGTTVAAGSANGVIWMWGLADGSLIRQFSAFSALGVSSLAYSPDGATLAAAGGNYNGPGVSYVIELFNAATASLVRTLSGHTGPISQIAYAPTGGNVLASAAQDLTVRIWNMATGATTQTINAFVSSGANCLAFSPDGKRVASGGEDSNSFLAKVWNVANGSLVMSVNACNSANHTPGVTAVAFSPDGTLLATAGQDSFGSSYYNSPKTFSIPSGALVNTFVSYYYGAVTSLAFSNDGATLISGDTLNFAQPGNPRLVLWNVASGTLVRSIAQVNSQITDAAFSSDGSQFALPNGPFGMQLRSVASGVLSRAPGGVSPFCYSPDGTLFAYSGNTIINVASGKTVRTLPLSYQALIWFSADGRTVYTYDVVAGILRSWRLRDGVLLASATILLQLPVAVSADGTKLAGCNPTNTQVTVWNVAGATLARSIPMTGISSNLSLNSNGAYIAFGAGTDAYVYRVSDGALMLDQPGGGGTVANALAVSPYGDSIAVGRSDQSVTVTSITGQMLAYWNDQLGTGAGVIRYSPDNTSILIGRIDATALLCYNPAAPALAGFTLNEATAFGGHDTPQGTVTLSVPAPVGTPVTLTSSNPAVASVPAHVTIGQGAMTAVFPVTTTAVSSPTPVAISAAYNGITDTVNLTVGPYVAPKSLSIAPATVQGGLYAVGVVTLLKQQAPPGGITFTLSSANPGAASVPSTVTVAAGSTSAHFLVQTGPVAATTPVKITATEGVSAVSGTLNVDPATVVALNLLPGSVQGGLENAVGIVTLAAPATADVTVTISVTTAATAGDVTYPATITIPAGAGNGIFEIGTSSPKTASDTVTFRAQIGATNAAGTTFKTASLTVTH